MGKKRRAWFRVADEVAFEDLSNDQLACLVRLMALMNTRWARLGLDGEAAGRISLGLAELYLVTGKHRKDVALTLLRSLADSTGLEVGGCEVAARSRPGGAQVAARWRAGDGQVTEIIWAKYPVFQGMVSPTQPQPPPPDATATSSARTRPKGGRKGAATEFPEPFPDEGMLELQAWAKRGAKTAIGRVHPSQQDIDAGIEAIGLWARANGKTKPDWPAAIKNCIRQDIAKRGSSPRKNRRETVGNIRDEFVKQIRAGGGEGGGDLSNVRPIRIGPGDS
jgi:hypothetical protein